MTEDPNSDGWNPTTDFRWIVKPAGVRVLQQKWTDKAGRVNWVDVRDAGKDEPT